MGETLVDLQKMHALELRLTAIKRARDAKVRQVDVGRRRLKLAEEKHLAFHAAVRERQIKIDLQSLDVASREDSIAKHRAALTKSKTNKEYAAVLTAMNTEKADSSKIEAEVLQLMEELGKVKSDGALIEEEQTKAAAFLRDAEAGLAAFDDKSRAELGGLQAQREAVAAKFQPPVLFAFNRASQRHDGEALAHVEKTHPKRDEYACSGCNVQITLDKVNALRTRDEMQLCPQCARILFFADGLAAAPPR